MNDKGAKTKEQLINQSAISVINGCSGIPVDMEPFAVPLPARMEYEVKVTDHSLQLPAELAKKIGLAGASSIRIVENGNRFEICPNIHSLAKLYIEPTSKCNLRCETCIRETWNEPLGSMDRACFDTLAEQIKEMESLSTVMFGGFGEPTFHPDILYMISKLKSLGLTVEMTTNGTLLNRKMAQGLIDSGLDTLWVSFDGCTPDIYEDIRDGANFRKLVDNIQELQSINQRSQHKVKIGIAFVVMKKNIGELEKLGILASRIGAYKVSVSNVIPYSENMVEQMICSQGVSGDDPASATNYFAIDIPAIDKTELTKQPLFELFKKYHNLSIMRNKVGANTDSCKFVQDRCTFIRWDGTVSPCMGLLHSYHMYFSLGNKKREVRHYGLGNIKERSLKDIWESQEYHEFREKVDAFNFSPCLQCASCDLASKNEEDCFGNTFPTCGGCLWGQGVIQCP